jgi:hypothetical protein
MNRSETVGSSKEGHCAENANEVESPKDSLDEVKAITHPGFGGPGRERYSLAI